MGEEARIKSTMEGSFRLIRSRRAGAEEGLNITTEWLLCACVGGAAVAEIIGAVRTRSVECLKGVNLEQCSQKAFVF